MRAAARALVSAACAAVLGVALVGASGAQPLGSVPPTRSSVRVGDDVPGLDVRHDRHGAAPSGAGPGAAAPTLPAAGVGALAGQDGPRLELLAHHDFAGAGLHADVWLHRGVAYVGTTAEPGQSEQGCPGTGVKVVEVAEPTQPVLAATLAQHPGTTAEVMRVRTVETPTFRGDLLAVGLQACRPEGLRGLELWDVTAPRAPRWLSYFEVQTAAADPVGGVHELDLVQRPDGRVLALLAVPFSEASHPERLGDFRVVEVTDPLAPQALASWGAGATLGLGSNDGRGMDRAVYAHSVDASADGLRAYVSYWDAGLMILDLVDPAAPRLLGRTGFAPGEEGNAHSVDVTGDGRVLIEADEVLAPNVGGLRLWDIADPARPRAIGAVHTGRLGVDPAVPGVFTAHNPVVWGDLLFVSWFSEGVRVLDIRDPAAPIEVAAWVPPFVGAPAVVRAPFDKGAQVWGVAVEGDVVVASDMNSGLYVLRLVR